MLQKILKTQSDLNHHWLDALEKNHVTYMALDPHHDKNIIEQLRTRPNWVIEFTTETVYFFARLSEHKA